MPLLIGAAPWLEKLLEESAETDPCLSPIRQGETMLGEVPDHIRPLLRGARHLREKMRNACEIYQNRLLTMERVDSLHKELSILQRQHDAVMSLFYASVRTALEIYEGGLSLREDWTIVCTTANESDSRNILIVEGEAGNLIGELVRAEEN